MAQALGGEVARTGAGEFGKTPITVRSRDGHVPRAAGRAVLDEPPRRRRRARPRASRSPPRPASSPVAAMENHGARDVRRPVPPRGGPHALRHRPPQVVPLRGLRLRAHLDRDARHRGAGRAHPRPGRRRAGDLRPLGRRRQRRRRADRPPRDRRPAHLRLRRPRPACATTRASRWRPPSASTSACRWCTSARRSTSSRRSPASPSPRRSARRSAASSSASSRRGRQAVGRALPGAGHALLRRHRVGLAHARPRSRATTTSAGSPRT